MQRDIEPQTKNSVTLESLVGAMLLSSVFLVYGAYGLYKNDLLLPTRVGIQHLQNIDAIAFYAVVLIGVPTNVIKLREWMKHGDGNSNAFKTADFYSNLSLYAYIVFLIFDVFS
jgi:hypothetical protein